MDGNAGNGHACHRGELKCHGVLTECRKKGMFVLCGFLGIRSSWYAELGIVCRVQTHPVPKAVTERYPVQAGLP